MKRLNLYCMALAVLAMGSCSLEHESIVPEEFPGMKFTAVWSDEASRTSLDENGTSVLWDPGDEIFIFQGVTAQGPSAMGKFKSTNAAPQSTATFTGTMEGECSGDYIAVYPYHPFHEFGSAGDMSEYGYGYMVVHMIYPVQQGVEGSFALRTAPAAAVSSTNELVFHNICGGVRFSITQSGVKKVTFSSIDGSPMSGIAYIVVGEDGVPVAMMGGMGGEGEGAPPYQSFVDVIAPEGGFVPGKNYYAIMAPQTHAAGLKVTLYGIDGKAERILSGPITVKRAVFGKLDSIDAGLEFVKTTPVPEIVDLGLSVKWASCNLGATKPEEFGDYFAWGETEPKEDYSWGTYKLCMGSRSTLTKYCNDSSYGYNDFTDNKTELDPEDDAATVNWGENWHMPTCDELNELKTQCTWTWTTLNGVYGIKVASKKSGYTDKWIFLPAAGHRYSTNLGDVGSWGNYWSSSLTTDYPNYAYYVNFNSSNVYWGNNPRYSGRSIRPVCD